LQNTLFDYGAKDGAGHRRRPPFFRCDVAREASARNCVRAVLRRFGRLDALINNAGIADPSAAPLEKCSR